MKKVIARCPGSCGELIQGFLGQTSKLVSYGVNRYTTITIKEQNKGNQNDWQPKMKQAAYLTCQYLSIPLEQLNQLSIKKESELPEAKGLSSSTADIAATATALAAYFQKKLPFDLLLKICLEIEATDSLLFPSLTLFAQNSGHCQLSSDWQPKFYVLMLEPSETLITEEFHGLQTDTLFYEQRHSFQQVFEVYDQAVQTQNLSLLGKAATESAKLNQSILKKPKFEQLLELKEEFPLLGINVAHSGTVVGLMFEHLGLLQPLQTLVRLKGLNHVYPRTTCLTTCYEGAHIVVNSLED